MFRPTTHLLRRALLATCFLPALASSQDGPVPSFGADVRPILATHCLSCHGPDGAKRKADLRLDRREDAVAAGAIVPGDAAASELVARIDHEDPGERMPPEEADRPLTEAQRDVLRRWIDAGADYEPHWAFAVPVRPALPPCSDDATVRNPIDAFVLARQRERGLRPAEPAARAALVRRLHLDLTGLPPAPEEVAAFVADEAPDAYERLVDRLLESEHFGERMALPWLDAARYADSNGYQHDGDRQSWPWRDWLIRALNADRPLDQLTTEMLAGDLLPHPTDDQLVATALQRLHPINNEGGAIPEEVRFQYVVDRVYTFGTMFLGLTVGCAQCHDHKFDPISQREYYELFAFFDQVDEDGRVSQSRANTYHRFEEAKPFVQLGDADAKARLEAARRAAKAAAEACKTAEKTMAAGEPERVRLRRARDAANRQLAELHEQLPVVMVMRDRDQPREIHLRKRGAYDQPSGEPLEPAVPAALGALPPDAPRNRLGLARWLVSPEHPLFARVLANRVWQTIFGRGLVPTPEDFGFAGQAPTHPRLLDWLATELVAGGYRLKHLVRLIVTSSTYRQSASAPPAARAADPEAIWLTRSPRYRWSSFLLRDQALAVSGLLDRTPYGPPVYPYHPEGLWLDVSFETFGYPHGRPGHQHRRSLYGFWRRTVAPPELFDAASRQACVVRPIRTNTPLHALVLLNDPTYVEAARALAVRARCEAVGDDRRLARLFSLAAGREPGAAELATLTRALQRERASFADRRADARALLAVGVTPPPPDVSATELAAWATVAQLVLNLDEVLTRP